MEIISIRKNDCPGQRVAWRAYNTTTPVVAAYSYDMLGRVTDIDADSSRVDLHYSYVPQEHNIAGIRFDHRPGTPYNSYGYDDLDRVTQVTYLNNDTEAFPMDDLGNRVGQVTQRDGVHTYSVDELTNRYTAIDANSLAYDDAGSLTQDKDGYRTTYDYENRPVRIAKLDGQTEVTVATFAYDALGRRIRKVDAIANNTSLYYYSDTWQMLADYDGSGVLQASYAYGNYIDEVLLMRRGGADYFYLHDHLYSPAALLSSSGAVVERYEYDVYGTCHIQAPDFSSRTASLYGNAFLFQGHMQDSLDSGSLKSYDFRYRAYDSFAGRWMQQDPMQYVDGLNFYEYASSMPAIKLDPYGMEKVDYWVDILKPYTTVNCKKKGCCLRHYGRTEVCEFSKSGWVLRNEKYEWAPKEGNVFKGYCKKTHTRYTYDRERYTGRVIKWKDKEGWFSGKYCIYTIEVATFSNPLAGKAVPGTEYEVHITDESEEEVFLRLPKDQCEKANERVNNQ